MCKDAVAPRVADQLGQKLHIYMPRAFSSSQIVGSNNSENVKILDAIVNLVSRYSGLWRLKDFLAPPPLRLCPSLRTLLREADFQSLHVRNSPKVPLRHRICHEERAELQIGHDSKLAPRH